MPRVAQAQPQRHRAAAAVAELQVETFAGRAERFRAGVRARRDARVVQAAAGQVRAEVESAIESYVTVVAGRRLPPVDFLTSGGPA